MNNLTQKVSATMYRWLTAFALVAFCSFNSNAQVTVTNPGNTTPGLAASYGSLAAAITDLNLQTAISGPVTITLDPANPQTAPAGGYVISATLAGASVANTVTIAGSNNTVTAFTPQTVAALNDGIIKIHGSDFITITGFTLVENPANIINTPAASNNMTEVGIALVYASTTNGCQNITIQNCTIDLNRTYTTTFGIYSNSTHSTTAFTTSATATTATGGNHNLVITGNTVTDVNQGIVVVGPTAAADQNTGLVIGGTAPNANTITNYGTAAALSTFANVSGTMNGILVRNSIGYTVSFNSITSSAGGVTTGTLRGIYNVASSLAPAGTFTNNINNNTIALTYGAATGTLQGITVEATNSTATSSLNINSNNFTALTSSVATSATITAITTVAVHLNTTINSNTFTNITTNTTGSFTFIAQTFTLTVAGGTKTVNSNQIVTGFTKTGAGGTVLLVTDNGSSTIVVTSNCQNNNFSNISVTGATTLTGLNYTDGGTAPSRTVSGNTLSNWTGGTNAINCMNFTYWSGVSSLINNTITNITGQNTVTGITIAAVANTANPLTIASNTITNLTSTGTGGAVTGITCTNTSPLININNNAISTLASTGAAAVTGISRTASSTTTNIFKNTICDLSGSNALSTVNGILVSTGATVNISNNRIGDLRAPAANAANPLNGINITGGTTMNVYYNTVNLSNAINSGALFGSSAISVSTTPTVTLGNNNFVNTSVFSGAGLTVAYRRSAVGLGSYGAASDRNNFSAINIFTDGATTITSIGAYKAFVAPRDVNSISVTPSFLSTTCGNANFLKLDPTIASQLESGAVNIAGITDDFENTIRQGNPGYLAQVNGGGTAPDIGADEYDGVPAPVCAGTPAASTITGASSICSGTTTTLSLSTIYTDLGISYQWQSSTVSGGPYTDMGTGSSQPTGILVANRYYICIITCSFSALSYTTAEYTLTVNPAQAVSVSPSSATVCIGGSVVLTANCESYTVTGTLDGAQEVPPSGSPGTGTVNAVYNGATNMMQIEITFLNLVGQTTNAHIHNAPSGSSGGVEIDLQPLGFPMGINNGNWTSPPFPLTAPQEAMLAAGTLYVNIHTTVFPAGEVRAQLTAAPCNMPSTYLWSPGATLSSTSIQSPTASPVVSPTIYTVQVTGTGGCTATSNVSVSIAPAIVVSALATPPSICPAGSSTLTATAGVPGNNVNVGTATTTIGGNNGNPYRSGNGVGNQIKTQLLYTAAELTAGGMVAGDVLGLGFTTTTTTGTLANFEIRIGLSSATVLTSTFETSSTTLVFTQATFTPVAGINMHTFNQGTFTWDGTSNILIQTCQTNSISGTSTVSCYAPGFTSNVSQQTSPTACSNPIGVTVVNKPIIRFNTLTPITNLVWQPGNLIGSPQIVSPGVTTVYTVTATDGFGCTATATATVTINPLACQAATFTTPNCAGNDFTVTANTTGGGAPFNYSWNDGVGGIYPNAATITANMAAGTYTFDCTVTDACGGSCNSIVVITVDPSPGGVATGPASGETYQNLPFSVTGYSLGSTFQWQSSTVGCGSGFANIPAATADNVTLVANTAGTFYIRVIVTGTNGCITTSNCITTVITVAGDNVCSANTIVVGNNGPYTNVGATTEVGEPVPPATGCTTQTGWCILGINNTVWFSFTPTVSGAYSFRQSPNFSNQWDSQFALYQADNCGDLLVAAGTLLAANDDSLNSPFQSYIAPICLEAGVTYYLQVDGYQTTTNNNFGILIIQNSSVAVTINSTTNATCFSAADGAVDVTVTTTGGPATVAWTGPEFGAIVVAKTPAHPYFGLGSALGFEIDGVEGKELTLVRGVTYSFNINSPGHPLYISTDADGAGLGEVLVGVTGSQTDFGTLTFTPDGTHPNLLYYQCYNHLNMGWKINIVNAPGGNDLASLMAGDYTITVTDANGCTATATTTVTEPAPANTYYYDGDGDTYGDAGVSILAGCTTPTNFVTNDDDCNDADPLINPGAAEICGNAVDEDCDGLAETVAPAQPSVISGAPVDVCPPATGINLSVTNDPNATSYLWYMGPGTTGVTFNPVSTTNAQTIDLAASTNTNYGIRVTASNACGTSPYRGVSIRRATSVPAAVTGPTVVCALGTYGYSTGVVTGATSYLWSGPAGTTFDGANPTPYTTVSNSVSATLAAGFTSGTIGVAAQVACFTSAVKTLAISQTVASFGVMTGNTVVCPNTSYAYSVPANAGIATYVWTVPAGGVINTGQGTNSITMTYGATVPGADVCVNGTSICGAAVPPRCKSVGPGTPARPASITGPSNGLCNQTVNYSCPFQAGVTFTWTGPAGSVINSGQGTNAISITFPTFSDVPAKTVCVVATNACGTSAARCITVRGAPNTPAAITAAPTSWCDNATGIVFTANLTGVTGSYTLSWTYPGATVATYVAGGGNTTSLTMDWLTGSGNVAVTTTNLCGQGTRTILAQSTCREGEETIAVSNDVLNVYPNPTSGNVTIEFSAIAKGNATVAVMDVAGRTVLSQNVTSIEGMNQIQLDLSTVAKGIYMLNVNTTEGNKKIKIVVE